VSWWGNTESRRYNAGRGSHSPQQWTVRRGAESWLCASIATRRLASHVQKKQNIIMPYAISDKWIGLLDLKLMVNQGIFEPRSSILILQFVIFSSWPVSTRKICESPVWDREEWDPQFDSPASVVSFSSSFIQWFSQPASRLTSLTSHSTAAYFAHLYYPQAVRRVPSQPSSCCFYCLSQLQVIFLDCQLIFLLLWLQ